MADAALPAAQAAVSLPARRARVMRRIESTRAAIGLEWNEFHCAVADGDALAIARRSARHAPQRNGRSRCRYCGFCAVGGVG